MEKEFLRNDDGIRFELPPYIRENVVQPLAGEVEDWGLRMLKVPTIWDNAQGEGIRIGVADTGVQANHPDLSDAVIGGKDFTGSGSWGDRQSHGTHCCGIIGARKNGIGMVGVAPRSSLIMAKVLGDDGSGSSQSVATGIMWLADQGCDVISVSLGSSQHSQMIYQAIKYCVNKGSVVVAAAGNSGPGPDTMIYPGAYPEVIGVGSINVSKDISRFSSRGSDMDIVAPGENIFSTINEGRYATYSGTSMACPFVAGVLGLYISFRRKTQAAFKLLPTDAYKIIKETATDAGVPGLDPTFGYGIINPLGIMALVPSPVPPPPPPPVGYKDHILRAYDDGRLVLNP